MSKEQEEPQDNYDRGVLLKAGEFIVNCGAVERIFTEEQWNQLKDDL